MSHLYQKYEVDEDLGNDDVRDALSGLEVSSSSPVGPAAREVGTAFETSVGEEGTTRYLVIRVSDPDDKFTKKSHTAISDTLLALDGVAERVESVGGYES